MSFWRSKSVKASRRARRCDHCHRPIAIGDPYLYLCGLSEGEFYAAHVHAECHSFVLDYTCTDEGWFFLHDFDPSDEDDLAELVRETPPSSAVMALLPDRWRAYIEEAIRPGASSSTEASA